jgi:rubrerythrin
MDIQHGFNANEVFEMALQLERNGAKFYRTAAEALDDAANKKLLLSLATMEDNHEKIFEKMKARFADEKEWLAIFDPHGEASLYLRAFADTRVFFNKEIDTSSMETIFKDAIIAEKDSIIFYLGMKDAVPKNFGKDKLDAIIKEEMSHVKLLSERLVSLSK